MWIPRPALDDALRDDWRELLASHHSDPVEVDAVFDDLLGRLHALDRWHHGVERLTEVLRWIERLEHRADDPHTVRLTAWVATSAADVARGAESVGSAQWAARVLSRVGVRPAVVTDVERLLTVLGEYDPDDTDADGEVLCDAQLAVLGAVAAEYRVHVDASRWKSGLSAAVWSEQRRQTVDELLRRDSVFRTPEMRAVREGRAQLNIAREATELRTRCLQGSRARADRR